VHMTISVYEVAMSLRQTANEILAILERGQYVAPSGATVDIAEKQHAAVAGTLLYTPKGGAVLADELESSVPSGGARCAHRVVVTDETTQAAAQRLAPRDPVLLNFASARRPGGGFLRGAKAQEEDLCRCSGLYPALLTQPHYYGRNRAEGSLLYTDHVIYSPHVPFFKVRGTRPPLEEAFVASVITAPAPNSGPIMREDPSQAPAIAEAFSRRWRIVLAIARHQGHRTVILGAWGCGAFGGDAFVAATAAKQALATFDGCFDQVVFAIPSKGKKSTHNLAVFREVLAG
jgi:uncharacterized protein (TIGR02452 family)